MKYRNPHAIPARQRKGGPHKMRGRKLPASAEIEEQVDDRVDVDLETETVRGADGKRIRLGTIVRRPPIVHALYGAVPTSVGVVKRVYRRLSLGDRVLVDYWGGGLRTAYADTLRRSQAVIMRERGLP